MRRLALLGDRWAPLMLGGYFAVSAFPLWSQYREEESVIFYAWLWPWVFAAAGVLTIAYALRPKHELGAVAGATMLLAVGARGISTLLTWANGELPWSRGLFAFLTWGVIGWLMAYVWIRLLEFRSG